MLRLQSSSQTDTMDEAATGKMMSVNSSSSFNDSLLSPQLSSIHSLFSYDMYCLITQPSSSIFVSFSVTNILVVLPLCVFILYLGFRRWRDQRSSSAAASHSDVFTYHMVVMEMFGIFGCGLYCFQKPLLMVVGLWFVCVTSTGQIFFHILTCVERHLAVVHPIIYLGLKNRGGVRIRNVAITCIWLVFLVSFVLEYLPEFNTIPLISLAVFSFVVISFCSLSVLRSLIRPAPGDEVGDRQHLNQTKKRAFHTIVTIMGALVVRCGGHLFVLLVHFSGVESETVRCMVLASGVWFSLPSSLVLPLLFLHRAGKLLS